MVPKTNAQALQVLESPVYPYLNYIKYGIKCLMKRTYTEINLYLHGCNIMYDYFFMQSTNTT